MQGLDPCPSSRAMKRRLLTSSSPLQESPPINKKIFLIESPSSSFMKDPTINTVSPPPAKIHHSDQLQPNHFVRLIPADSSSSTTPASPSLQVSPYTSNYAPFTSSSENNETNINNVNSALASNSLVSCFNSKSSLPFKRQRNSVPLTTSENSSDIDNNVVNYFLSLTEIAEHHNPPHPQPQGPPPPYPQPPHPDPDPHPQPNPHPQNPNPHPPQHPNAHPPHHPNSFHPPPLNPPAQPPFHPIPPLPENAPNPPAVWRICCIGATRIGTVTMMMIANFCPNVDISIVDEDEDVIDRAIQGVFPFYEPHLQQLNNHLNGLNPRRLRFTQDIEHSILNAHIIFIGIGIKSKSKPPAKKGQVECTEWMNVWKYLVRVQNIHDKIIVELTTLPLDFEIIFSRALGYNLNDYQIILNPSFISEGRAIHDIYNPSIVVLAYTRLEAAHVLFNIYHEWVPLQSIYAIPNLHSAVLAKLGLNSILASRVVLINTLNYVSERCGAERRQFSHIITQDYRIEEEYFDPGIGFGGPSLEKSLYFLSEAAHQKGLTDESRFFKQMIKSNDTTRKRFVKEMQVDMGGTVEKRIAILGFSYKKNTNTFENSPVIKICLELVKEEGALIRIFDPIIPAAVTRRFFNNYRHKILVMEDPYDACVGADAVCILTDWDQFLDLDFAHILGGMRFPHNAHIFFGRHRNIHPPHLLQQLGFRVYAIL